MQVFQTGSKKSDYAPFFGRAELPDNFVVITKDLRAEELFKTDENPSQTVAHYIEHVATSFGGNVFLLASTDSVARPRKLRTYKGVLWNYKGLRSLSRVDYEIAIPGGTTRLASLVDLAGYDFETSRLGIMQWFEVLIILTDSGWSDVAEIAPSWISAVEDVVFPFDFQKIADDLAASKNGVIFRYGSPWNHDPELIVLAGDEAFVDDRVMPGVNGRDIIEFVRG